MKILQQSYWVRLGFLFFWGFTVCLAGVSAETGVVSVAPNGFEQARPATWATPLSRDGLPNFFKINDGFYRGAQPTAVGIKELKKMGIKTVVNLRAFHDDKEILKDSGLAYERIEFKTWHPETEDIIRFLSIVTDSNKTPVFVHCQHGADRTGTMCALYRIVVCGWDKESAIQEMTQGGYGFHTVWENLLQYIRGLDTDVIKNKLLAVGEKKAKK